MPPVTTANIRDIAVAVAMVVLIMAGWRVSSEGALIPPPTVEVATARTVAAHGLTVQWAEQSWVCVAQEP